MVVLGCCRHHRLRDRCVDELPAPDLVSDLSWHLAVGSGLGKRHAYMEPGSLEISPLVQILAVLSGGEIAGVVGALVCGPGGRYVAHPLATPDQRKGGRCAGGSPCPLKNPCARTRFTKGPGLAVPQSRMHLQQNRYGGRRPSFSTHVRSHGSRGRWANVGHPSQFLLGSVRRATVLRHTPPHPANFTYSRSQYCVRPSRGTPMNPRTFSLVPLALSRSGTCRSFHHRVGIVPPDHPSPSFWSSQRIRGPITGFPFCSPAQHRRWGLGPWDPGSTASGCARTTCLFPPRWPPPT